MCYSTGTIYFAINPEELYGRYEKNSVKNVLLQIKFWKRHASNKTFEDEKYIPLQSVIVYSWDNLSY
jgi:hypothetical protein